MNWTRIRSAFHLGGLTPRELAERTWKKINDNEILTRASAVAFYAMLALVPVLTIVLTLAVRALPDLTGRQSDVGDQTVDQFRQTLTTMVPPEATELVESQIRRLQEGETQVELISIGLLIALWSAGSLFLAVMDAMNRVNGVTESRPFWKIRLVAIVMALLQAVILIGSLLAILAWPQIMGWLGLGGVAAAFATAVKWVVLFLMVLLSFALAFYVGPDADQKWEWITPGSLVGTALFLLASFGFRVYVQNFADYNATYGSLGGVMVLLLWFWISAVVLLSAGQMNQVIEDASPVGKSLGQKTDPTTPPDLDKLAPVPYTEPSERR